MNKKFFVRFLLLFFCFVLIANTAFGSKPTVNTPSNPRMNYLFVKSIVFNPISILPITTICQNYIKPVLKLMAMGDLPIVKVGLGD